MLPQTLQHLRPAELLQLNRALHRLCLKQLSLHSFANLAHVLPHPLPQKSDSAVVSLKKKEIKMAVK